MAKPKVVFFGTGPVSLKTLEGIGEYFEFEAIITGPDRQHHGKPILHPVKDWAIKHKIPTLQPSNKDELLKSFSKASFKSTLGLVVDYGLIIPDDVLSYFQLGIINSHFSLLPRWRGADPITFSILKGDAKTGVSLMIIESGLDTGKIIVQKSLPIDIKDTTPSLTEKLIELSNQLLVENLPKYIDGLLKPRSQPHPDRATYSRRLVKADGLINWNKPAEQIEREVRAYAGWPGSYTKLAGKDVIITKAHAVPSNASGNKPGYVDHQASAGIIMVECGKGTLCIERLKPAGKTEMSAADFARGYLK